MPTVEITYDEQDVRNLIAADIENRFGIKLSDDQINPSLSTEHEWGAVVERGSVDASKANDG